MKTPKMAEIRLRKIFSKRIRSLLNESIFKIFLFLSHWKSVVTRDKREVVIGGWSIRKRVLQCEKMNKILRKREKNNPNLNSPKIDDESLIEEPR